MKRIGMLLFLVIFQCEMLLGVASAEYIKVDTLKFLEYAGGDAYYIMENNSKPVIGTLMIVVASVMENLKDQNYKASLSSEFCFAIGASNRGNKLEYILYNQITDKYKVGYIDFDEGLLYTDDKELELEDALLEYMIVNTNDSLAYGVDDMPDILKFFQNN